MTTTTPEGKRAAGGPEILGRHRGFGFQYFLTLRHGGAPPVGTLRAFVEAAASSVASGRPRTRLHRR
ncbi:hypothetical protein ACRAWF_00775 [Streptomyces sp. L7]